MQSRLFYFPDSFPVIETDRLLLREIQLSDVPAIYQYLSDPQVVKYMGLAPYQTQTETREEFEWYKKIFKEHTGLRWGITVKDSKHVIGSCGFLNIKKPHYRAEIGYELHPDFWSKGIATEALLAVVDFGFRKMNLNRIEALVEPDNKASIKLLETCNFTQEGLLRQYERTADKFDDLYMYSLLRGDMVEIN